MNTQLLCFLKKDVSRSFIVTVCQHSEALVLQYLKFSHIIVNLSLELGTLVWFSFSFIPKLALETLDFKLSFRFPPPQVIGLNVVVGGWGGGITICKR